MRVAWLLVLAGCFKPEPEPNQPCTDWCPPPERCVAGTCRVDDAARPNYAFVTSDRRSIIAETTATLDDWCRTLARDNHMTGDYVAWMSTAQTSITSRLGTLAARGWMRPDGRPFADTVDDIVAGRTYYPLRIGNDGADVGTRDENVATGTEANGDPSAATCEPAAPGALITIGKADAGLLTWTASASASCAEQAHVYCFGTDRGNPLAPPTSPPGAKRAFVTRNPYTKKTPADADLICRNEGNDPSFVALLATSTRSVSERFDGVAGPWVRPDGVIVTEDMTAFVAPLELAPDGTRLRVEVWFGAKTLKDRATADRSCDDWTTGGSVRTGQSERSIGAAPFDTQNGGCGNQYHFYCAQL